MLPVEPFVNTGPVTLVKLTRDRLIPRESFPASMLAAPRVVPFSNRTPVKETLDEFTIRTDMVLLKKLTLVKLTIMSALLLVCICMKTELAALELEKVMFLK